ncbi:MAG: hypothetical protein [Microviridae sp.]|nr:MAG: hypothetical protein [Microviridae sp.]
MSTETLDTLRTQMNVQEQHSSTSGTNPKPDKLINRRQIDGTPFYEIEDQYGTYIVMGKYRLTDDIKEQTAETYIKENQYTIILQMLCCVITDIKTQQL